MQSDDASERQLNEGKMKLMKMEWNEAEHSFMSVLKLLGCQSTDNANSEEGNQNWIRIEALTGLGELEARRCQRFCYDDLTWFQCMFRSISFYKVALQMFPKKSKRNSLSKRNSVHSIRGFQSSDPHEAAFYNQSESRVQYQIKTLENLTVSALSEKILTNCLTSSNGKTLTFDDDWLKQLISFCSREREPPTVAVSSSKESARCREEEEKKNFQPIYKRKIDYERVQEAIMKLVDDVSIDVRRHYSCMTRLVPQKLIQQRLMLEISRRLTPGTRGNLDLMEVIENAISYEDISEMKKEICPEIVTTDQSTVMDFDEENDNDDTLYLDIGQSQIQDTSAMQEYQDSSASLYNIKDLTRASSPSCQSKKSHLTRLLHQQLETSSSGRISQATCAKTTSSRRSGQIFDAGSAMPSKATRMKNIMTIWRASRHHGSVSGASSSATQKKLYGNLQNFEEVSPLTEREKVLNWLQGVEEPPTLRVSKTVNGADAGGTTTCHNWNSSQNQSLSRIPESADDTLVVLSTRQLKHTILHSAKKAADILGQKEKYCEALEVYKFALSVLRLTASRVKHENELMAELLKSVGMTKCSLGQTSVGCQLMQESVGIYSQLEDDVDTSRVSEIWYQLGGAFLSEELRQDSLFLRTMQLVQKELDNEEKIDLLNPGKENFRDDESDSSDESDGYCICIFEAMECYRQALNLFADARKNGHLPNTELYLKILCELADCYFMAGNLDQAEARYEEALLLFPRVRDSSTIKKNSHVLSMLGSLNFLLGNYVRAATMFETSHILNQHRVGSTGNYEEPTLQKAWNLAMLGLSCYHLDHFDKTVAWCTRAFSLYTAVLRGSLFNADYYNHWFVIENLYSLGTAYATMDFFEKGVYYLNLGRNLINGCEVKERQDTKQHVKVLRGLADAHASLDETNTALKYYEEAVEISKMLGEDNTKTALQNQLLNKMACVNVDARNYVVAETNLEQALDYQKDVEASIKADMAAVLRRLGATSILACDVDKAIACYKDCIQVYREMDWLPGGVVEIVKMLCTLATLYHVKSCMLDDENQVELFMTISEGCFQEAIVITEENALDVGRRVESSVDLQYANFLYQQGLIADALHALLPVVFCRLSYGDTLVYSGIEQAVLPDHLQSDFTDDSMVVEAQVLAYFLAILCYKGIGLMTDADDVLLLLYKYSLAPNSTAFACNVCAYAFMEMGMFLEACDMFFISSVYKKRCYGTGDKSGVNFWICLCVCAYMNFHKAIRGVTEFLFRRYNICSKEKRFSASNKFNADEDSQMSSVKRQHSSEAGSDLAFCSDSGEMIETWEEWTEEYVGEPWMLTANNQQFIIQPTNESKDSLQQRPKVKIREVGVLEDKKEKGEEKEILMEETYAEEVVYEENLYNSNFHQLKTSVSPTTATTRAVTIALNTTKKTGDNKGNKVDNQISSEINGNQPDDKRSGCSVCSDEALDGEEVYEEWVTFEEIVDTPVEILAFLNNNGASHLLASSYI